MSSVIVQFTIAITSHQATGRYAHFSSFADWPLLFDRTRWKCKNPSMASKKARLVINQLAVENMPSLSAIGFSVQPSSSAKYTDNIHSADKNPFTTAAVSKPMAIGTMEVRVGRGNITTPKSTQDYTKGVLLVEDQTQKTPARC